MVNAAYQGLQINPETRMYEIAGPNRSVQGNFAELMNAVLIKKMIGLQKDFIVWDASKLAAGMYMLQVKTNQNLYRKKLKLVK